MTLSSITPTTPIRVPASTADSHDGGSTHEIAYGDTLSAIAGRRGVSLDALIAANPQIVNPDVIYPGDRLNIPASDTDGSQSRITIQPGDTLGAIAAANGTSVRALASTNGISNPDRIRAGDVLTLIGATQGSSATASDAAAASAPIPVTSTPGTPAPATQDPAAPAGAPAGSVDYQRIAGVAGNPNVTPEFIRGVESMAERLGTRPDYLLGVMSFETGGSFAPDIRNSIGATGLIQFLPSTARGLGTSTDALADMSSVEQLQVVEQYFEPYRGKLDTLEGVYSSVLSGTATPDPNATLPDFERGRPAYESNAGLDFNNDGRVSSGEATSAVASRLFGGVSAVQQQLVDAGAVPTGQRDGFIDGRFGGDTSAAIARFQTRNALPPTGLLDDATGRALFDGTPSTDSEATDTPAADAATTGAGTDLQLSDAVHERGTPGRQTIQSPVIGEFILTEGFMARGGPHSSKSERQAIFQDNPTVAETVPAGVYNLGIDYVTTDGQIQSWFSGEVIGSDFSASGYGNRLITRSDQTFNYQGQDYPVFAHYAHADSFNVNAGDRISAGQVIGDQGSTGGSTGDHVDFLTWIELDSGQRLYISPNLLSGG